MSKCFRLQIALNYAIFDFMSLVIMFDIGPVGPIEENTISFCLTTFVVVILFDDDKNINKNIKIFKLLLTITKFISNIAFYPSAGC